MSPRNTGPRFPWMVLPLAVLLSTGEVPRALSAQLEDVTWDTSPSVRYQDHETSAYGEFASPALILARSEAEWDDAMAALEREGGLIISPPRRGQDLGVDFKKYDVVLLAVGQMPMGAIDVQVKSVRCHANELLIDVDVDDPNPGMVRISSAYQLIVVPHRQWSLARARCHGSGPSCIPKESPPPSRNSTDLGVLSAPCGVGIQGASGGLKEAQPTWAWVKNKYR